MQQRTESDAGRDPFSDDHRDELGRIQSAFESAAGGSSSLVLISGEAGMGKTSLAAAGATAAESHGAFVAWGRCWEGGEAPAFWPWVEILRVLLDSEGAPEALNEVGERRDLLADLVPDLRTETTGRSLSGTDHRFAVFDAVAGFLRVLSNRHPLVLIIEDLHAADASTLQLLDFLFLALRSSRVLFVATVGESDLRAPDAPREQIFSLARRSTRIDLRPLSREAVSRIYREVTGEEASAPAVDALYEATEGNPFFVREAIRLLADEGSLRRPDHSLGFRVPEGVGDLLRRRLSHLPDSTLAALTISAVVGREFEVEVVASVLGRDPPAVLDDLDDARRTGVVREVSASRRFRFSHALIRETLYEDIPMSQRMKAHAAVADALERASAGDERLEELAHHYFKAAQAADRATAIDYLIRAGNRAVESMAYEASIRFYERALRVGTAGGMTSARRTQVERALARAHALVGDAKSGPDVHAAGPNVFRSHGDYWEIVYDGRPSQLKDAKGLRYIYQLVKNPGREIHVLELLALESGPVAQPPRDARAAARTDDIAPAGGDVDSLLDEQAKSHYRRRLEDLREQVEEGEAFNDPERVARAQAEIDALLTQLAHATGLGGRDRKAITEAERARSSITKAIKAALVRLGQANERLGEHFEVTVRTGVFCSYTPDPHAPAVWETS